MLLVYDIKLTTGVLATIVYCVLVGYLFRFLFVYFKRLFTIALLTIFAPFVGISYAMDKIKSNKTSKKLNWWMKEYSVNVLIQSVHAVLYIIFIGTIIKLIENVSLFKNLIPSLIIIFPFLSMMLKSETIVKNIFKMGGGGSSLKDLDGIKVLPALLAVSTFAGKSMKKYAKMPIIQNSINNINNGIKNLNNDFKEFGQKRIEEAGLSSDYDIDPVSRNASKYGARGRGETLSHIDEKIRDTMEESKKKKKITIKNAYGDVIKIGKGIYGIGLSIPLLVEAPLSSIIMGLNGYNSIKSISGGGKRNIKNSVSSNENFKGKRFVKGVAGVAKGTAKGVAALATAGLSITATEYVQKYGNKMNEINSDKIEKLEMLYRARNKEIEIAKDIDKLKKDPSMEGTKKDATPVKKALTNKYVDALKKSLYQKARKIEDKKIKRQINKILANKQYVELKDIEKIAKTLEVKDKENSSKDIKFTKDFIENLKAEVLYETIQTIKGNETKIDKEAIEKIVDKKVETSESLVQILEMQKMSKKENLDKKMYVDKRAMQGVDDEKLNELRSKVSNEPMNINEKSGEGKSFSNVSKEKTNDIVKTLSSSKKEKENRIDNSLLYRRIKDDLNAKTEMEEDINEKIAEEITTEEVDNVVKNLNADDLTNLIARAIKRKGSMKEESVLEKFEPIVEKFEELNVINDKMKEKTGGPIYENTDSLIGAIISKIKGAEK